MNIKEQYNENPFTCGNMNVLYRDGNIVIEPRIADGDPITATVSGAYKDSLKNAISNDNCTRIREIYDACKPVKLNTQVLGYIQQFLVTDTNAIIRRDYERVWSIYDTFSDNDRHTVDVSFDCAITERDGSESEDYSWVVFTPDTRVLSITLPDGSTHVLSDAERDFILTVAAIADSDPIHLPTDFTEAIENTVIENY